MAKASTETTVIAYGVRLEGQFVSEGDIQIEGEVHGSIESKSDLRVGDRAKIRADVNVSNAHVSGEIRGNLVETGRLELTETAHVVGDITAQIIVMAQGARINGQVSMGEDGRMASKTSVAPDPEPEA